ncbi:MAG: cyclic nucleotide-binding domain-containing protein [Bacteroides graminisolvens]|nr:cyclic nucleotide-binding domain-containing protein [Bacteroides graminisolvens]
MIDNLKIVLKQFADFDEDELNKITDCFKNKTVQKNTVLLKEGIVCNEFYFIHTGCVRIFFIDKNGYEKTRYIMLDSDMNLGTALTSFISQNPSIEYIEALDDTVLLAINHSDFYRLNTEMPNWRTFYQRILEMAYSFQSKRVEHLVTLTAKQRYDNVLKENPFLIQRLSNRILASYLDIREETLSRLKSK